MSGGAPPRARDEWPALAALGALFAVAWVVVGAWSDTPHIDDWVYGWSVEQLVTTGRLRVLPISAIYPVAQVLWAAPFAAALGFSFVALRLSTAVLAVLGCWAAHLTLRELGASRHTSLLGALSLALHPVYFALAFSFMTEVPFVSLAMLSLYGYVRGLARDDARAVWLGSACALAAYLVRPIGVLLPVAGLLAALSARRGTLAGRRGVAFAVPLAIMAGLQLGLPRLLGPLDWAATRSEYLQWWFTVPLKSYAIWTVEILVQAIFPVAPLVLAALTARGHVAAAAITAGLAVICWGASGHVPSPLPDDQTWTLQEFTARSMVGGRVPPPAWTEAAQPWLQAAGLYVLGGLAVVVVGGGRDARRKTPVRDGGARWVVPLYGALQLGAIQALWLYNDRYYLVMAPALVVATAWVLDGSARGRRVAAGLLAVWALLDLTGTRDMLSVMRTARDAVGELEAAGIPPWQIDAGYTLNGWRLYAHQQLPPGADRSADVPHVTSAAATPYAIVNVPPPGTEVMRQVPLVDVTWQATRAFYVVRRPLAAATPVPR